MLAVWYNVLEIKNYQTLVIMINKTNVDRYVMFNINN